MSQPNLQEDSLGSTPTNSVTIQCSPVQGTSISSITYIPDSFEQSNGKDPSSGPTVSGPVGTTWTIAVTCPRKGSTQIANNYASTCSGQSHTFSPHVKNADKPAELNFFFGITVEFAGAAPVNLYLAQGHRSKGAQSINNWWIGGANVNDNGPSTGLLVLPTNPNTTFEIKGGADDLTLGPWKK